MKRVLAALAVGVALFGLVTWLALEGRDVAVLHTRAPDGSERTTRVWVAEADGALWIEAATPERPWYRDLQAQSELTLQWRGRSERRRAVPEPGAAGHRRVRAWLRAKYGWADAWVGLLQDTSRSIAVRLERAEPA